MDTRRPRIRRGHRVETVPGEAVYLVSEREHHVVEGALVERVLPLLNGKHDVDDLLDQLDDIPPEQVLYLIERLVAMKAVVWADPDLPEREAGFWDVTGVAAEQARERLAQTAVALAVAGEVDPGPVLDALASAGVQARLGEAGEGFRVVVTDNYLNPDLARHNETALRTGRPWLLAKPVGLTLWVGPVFKPGGGCWACLAYRLSGHRQVDEYLRDRAEHQGPLRVPLADLAVTRDMGARLVALETAKHLAGLGTAEENGVLTLDTIHLDSRRHALHRRPQCPQCGDDTLAAQRMSAPVLLAPRPKVYTGDGGHRAKNPDQVLETYGPQVSPVTGVVRELRPYETGIEFVKGYSAGHNFARRVERLSQLRKGLRSMAAGKGTTDTQARASAICEAIERYSGLFGGDEPRRTATLAELGEQAVAPNDIQLYSERQYASRAEWNSAQRSSFQTVCDPLPADEPIEWSPVWSLTNERTRYVATSQLFYCYPTLPPGKLWAWACSNGNAAGASLEDAILQGFLELVERDSVALWWYNRVQRPAYDLASFGDPWFDEFVEVYRGLHREVHVLDITADLGIPAAAAISWRVDKPAEDILIGLGAHFDAKLAVQRALAEQNQFLPAVLGVQRDGTGYAFPDAVQQEWWREARIADHPYLSPAPGPATRAGDRPDLSSMDLRDDVLTARRLVESRGMEFLVLDQTRPDIGLPVVKVIVPGMRHFWARFGPGRLYDTPVALGWRDAPIDEADLNPIPMFL
ncbi:TOMM precursor leader peptide-binding protein [Phytohabitans sp. ZYX-F-186]|uniref:TOMM leader peptide-binding protein n=1 Tax=Phytohabitans maris TaxID=3071409 RepID=A0ABU0ZAR7_9ACTN|nr:TOMM precursor leader peptide-binding protein [Phytohabitans sp. ZYX-F-186]MDQ7904158.1 TOMM precursor leader peptide-binding protein [Phytohabitans sp. ZYX-F-186]